MATLHDYRDKFWGHDYVWEPRNEGQEGHVIGWGYGIRRGDYILLQNGAEGSRYCFKSIKYFPDPPDMFSGELVFAPRSGAMKEREHKRRLKSFNLTNRAKVTKQ